jgi:predicted nucleic acid-binding protein
MPLWRAKQAGSTLVIRTSELTILESLVAPLRSGDTLRQAEFDAFFASGAVDVVPISRAILSEAARLRAATARLRTPDAIHAATALQTGCSTFLTNDASLRNIPGVSTTYLGDVTP